MFRYLAQRYVDGVSSANQLEMDHDPFATIPAPVTSFGLAREISARASVVLCFIRSDLSDWGFGFGGSG